MSAYLETFRTTVTPADCDLLGHMNVQHYFRAVGDGMIATMTELGLTPDEIRRRAISFAVVHAETDFHRELRAGDVIALESTVRAVGDKSATFHHRLRNVATGVVAMDTEFRCAFLDLHSRRAVAVPDDIRHAAARRFSAGS
jgi:acyl-CoA thioester hydrolase